MGKCSKCGQQTPQVVLDATGREVKIGDSVLWLRPTNTIEREGTLIRLAKPFAVEPIVLCPYSIASQDMNYCMSSAPNQGRITDIHGKVGKRNPAIYKLTLAYEPNTSPVVLDAIGREVTVPSSILWLRPSNVIERAGVRVALNETFTLEPVVLFPHTIRMGTFSPSYCVGCKSDQGNHVEIRGKTGERNPVIYVLAADRSEL